MDMHNKHIISFYSLLAALTTALLCGRPFLWARKKKKMKEIYNKYISYSVLTFEKTAILHAIWKPLRHVHVLFWWSNSPTIPPPDRPCIKVRIQLRLISKLNCSLITVTAKAYVRSKGHALLLLENAACFAYSCSFGFDRSSLMRCLRTSYL